MIVLPQMLTVPSRSSKASVMILSRNMLKRVGEKRHPCRPPPVISYAAVEEDCTGALIMEVFDDSDKVGTDVLLLIILIIIARTRVWIVSSYHLRTLFPPQFSLKFLCQRRRRQRSSRRELFAILSVFLFMISY